MMANETKIPAVRPTGLLGSEDWWAVWLGLFITLLGLGKIWGFDLLGWAATFGVWIDPAKAVGTGSKAYAWLGSAGALAATWVFTLAVTSLGAHFMKADVKKFAGGFSVIYWITILSNILGNYAYLAATPNKREAFHIGWSLSLGELGFVFALLAGLVIGNFFPGLAKYLSHAAKPEWYIKTGIVILGANIGIQANLLRAVFFGLCFFSIGLVTNVRKLWKAGLGRVIGAYSVALAGFIIWVGLGISYIFYHGILPPTL